MNYVIVTAKGGIVIPSKLRRKFGIKKGTQVCLYERDSEIAIKPITDELHSKHGRHGRDSGQTAESLDEGESQAA